MSSAELFFLPWMRRGLTTLLASETNRHGIPVQHASSTLTASVHINENLAERTVRLLGPEAVIGLQASQILRCFPAPNTVNFDRDDFVHIELNTPDLPWMFTPGAPTKKGRLIPWMVLVVVEEGAGMDYAPSDPLPVLHVEDAGQELPPLQQAYAWAHVQCTTSLQDGLETVYARNPGAFMARLIAPRRLQRGRWYRACLVPSFRSGRDAGLGRPVDILDEEGLLALAWEPDEKNVDLPVYYSWRFRTKDEKGDFETLVSKLEPRTLPEDAGVHALEIGDPGSEALPKRPNTVLGYKGVFVSPIAKAYKWPEKHQKAFREKLQGLLEKGSIQPEKPEQKYNALKDDPIVAPPLYGSVQAGTYTLKAGWMQTLNLDPPERTVAGLGAEIVRRHQEALMADAWDQAASIQEANALLNRTRLALEVGNRLKKRVEALEDGRWIQWSRGVHKRLRIGSNKTFHGAVADSLLPNGIVSAAFRRRLRRGTSISRAFETDGKRNVLVISQVLTTDFVQEPEHMLKYAAFQMPPGVVWIDGYDPTPSNPSRKRKKATRPSTIAKNPALDTPIRTARRGMHPEKFLGALIRQLILSPDLNGKEGVPSRMWINPDIERPLYEDLVRMDAELLMPGVSLLKNNSVALAQLNTAFVESFLAGANHELGREFLWREYPADLTYSWLRMFWDAFTDQPEEDEEHSHTDISPISHWKLNSTLGSHGTFKPDTTIVLIIKGELLQRYPNTLIYATPARWDLADEEGKSDKKWERIEKLDEQAIYPSLYGKLSPDITFIGLDFSSVLQKTDELMTVLKGSSSPPKNERQHNKPAGWFFAFEQLPEEPHFGMDTQDSNDRSKKPDRWENLTWYHAMGKSESAYVDLDILTDSNRGTPPKLPYDDQGANANWEETWAENGASMARITWQRPVRMLVHAEMMLRPPRAK